MLAATMKTTQYKRKFLESTTGENLMLKDAATLALGNPGGADWTILVQAS